MSAQEQLMLNRAAFSGNARAMEDASYAVSAIADVLGDGGIELSGYQHEGLTQALKIVADSLNDRAAYIGSEILGREGDE
ncbi:hypothetical protein [Halomonas sp. B23F22_10]|uniref:hypothetical protein n=1 Tax=Halomonas sp. B23F22_10 TaxID=3459515 RepID=UPI00373E586A